MTGFWILIEERGFYLVLKFKYVYEEDCMFCHKFQGHHMFIEILKIVIFA